MIERVRIASPCPANCQTMTGDDRVRYCPECKLNVYNFSAMTSGEVERLIAEREGRLCARVYRRADGTILTKNCPVGFRAVLWRPSRVASVALAALIALCSAAAQSGSKANNSSTVPVGQARRASALRVFDPSGGTISGAEVALTNETSGETIMRKTDKHGEIKKTELPTGSYRIVVSMPGFETLTRDHVSMPAPQVVTMTLRVALLGQVIVISSPMETIPGSPHYELVEPPHETSPAPRRSAFGRFLAKVRHIV